MQNSSPTSSDSSAGSTAGLFHSNKLSAIELAAQRGIGPMSPQGLKVWHGESYPCVSCGELVRRSAIVCDQCGQDLSLRMIVKMQAHAGPWFVLEHVRPFPGVTLERLIRQAQKGVLTATTIVRGPTTYHQWRFAAETPALSKHLGLCWNCQAHASATDTRCTSCGIDLDQPAGVEHAEARPVPFAPPPPPPTYAPAVPASPRVPQVPAAAASPQVPQAPVAVAVRPAAAPATVPDAGELARIRAAFGSAPAQTVGGPKRGMPMGLIIGAILLAAIGGLFAVVRMREQAHPQPTATPSIPPLIIPGTPPKE